MKNSKQFVLERLNCLYRSDEIDEFILGSNNHQAHDRITTELHNWHSGSLLLLGDSGSGKTHLSQIWRKLHNAIQIEHGDYSLFEQVSDYNKQPLLCEDIESCDDHEFLFHLINHCQENRIHLLLTARCMIDTMIDDLSSRLDALDKVVIEEPSVELLRIIMIKSFSDRQIKVDVQVLDYIIKRVERSFSAVKKLIQRIDHTSLHKGGNITISLVKSIMDK